MDKSLFRKAAPEVVPPSPYELIGPEIGHLKKGVSTRHGPHGKVSSPPWLIIFACFALCGIYLMDPFFHAWYKGEAIRTYLYLHNYGTGPLAGNLVASQIFAPDEVEVLNHRTGSFQDYYASAEAANQQAAKIISYMTTIHRLHNGVYQQLSPLEKLRYVLFIRNGIYLPTQWSFLEPTIAD